MQAANETPSATNSAAVGEAAGPLLSVSNLSKHFAQRNSLFSGKRNPVRAVDGVDLTLERGKTLGLALSALR